MTFDLPTKTPRPLGATPSVAPTIALALALFAGGCGDDPKPLPAPAKSAANAVAPASSSSGATSGASGASGSTGSGAPAASASASDLPDGPNPCAPLKLEGDGSIHHPCRVTGPMPITAKWTGEYKPDFDGEKPAFTVTSKLDRAVTWGNVAIYYYDKSGKQLEVTDGGRTYKKFWISGGLLQVPAKGTTELKMGWVKDKAPADTAAIEVEIEGYGFTDVEPGTFFENPDLGHEDRLKGGNPPPKSDDKKADDKKTGDKGEDKKGDGKKTPEAARTAR